TTGVGEANLIFPTVIRHGVVTGRLVGGCLSLLVASLGTSFAIDTTEKILFIEDIGEKPYRIDRMLTQLKQSGKLDKVAGVIFSEMTGCLGDTSDPGLLLSVIAEIFAEYSYPIGFGLPAGHVSENFALPFGTRVQLDTIHQTLTFLEPAVE